MVNTQNLIEQFNHLLSVISSEKFLSKKGLGNEVPFFICPYASKKELEMQKIQNKLVNQLNNRGIKILSINLYNLSLKILEDREILEQILELEKTVSKGDLLELLQGVLDSETHLVPAIAKILNDNEFDVLFLSGVGAVFPYIRSHNVLNNLQSQAQDKPTVIFFPGTYNYSLEMGESLDLFSSERELRHDKYYRAFNINDYEI